MMPAIATQPVEHSTPATPLTRLGFLAAAVLLLFNCAMLIYIAPRYFIPIFEDFEIQLPWLTIFMFSDTGQWIGVLSGLFLVTLSGIVIATRRDRQSTTVCTLFGLALSVPVALWLMLGLLLPLISLYASV